MLYLVTHTIPLEKRALARQRFTEIAALAPVDGVRRLGRWFDLAGHRAFAIMETDDPVRLAVQLAPWAELANTEVTLVGDDAQVLQYLQATS